MDAISDLPMLHDMDADYSPRYVQLARILRGKITSGRYQHGDPVPASGLVRDYKVSAGVARHALEMLAANRYLARAGDFRPYHVTWQPSHGQTGARA